MDDPDWSWPAWKFGMKRDELFTKLHDEYNTFPSSIQDPEAFHHDVFEVSHNAATADEFHRQMAARKEKRLRELNESLESAAVEIIANPSLVGTDQWQYALQLFRTKSLDSLVRYFASYLPDEHPWHRSDESVAESDDVSDESVANSLQSSFCDDKPIMTDEPLSLTSELPPSPRSMTTCSDVAATSGEFAHHAYELNPLTPARTLSFSESEPEHFSLKDSCPHLHEDDTSQSSDAETPRSSISDPSETHQAVFLAVTAGIREEVVVADHDDEYFSSQMPADSMESETPTPKPDVAATSFFDVKLSPLSSLRRRSLSPSRASPLANHTNPANESRRSQRSPKTRRRDCSPAGRGRRRSPGGVASRIHKPLPDQIRSRPSGRRRVVDC